MKKKRHANVARRKSVTTRNTKRAAETMMTTVTVTTRESVNDTVIDLDLAVQIVVTRRIGIRLVVAREIAGAEVEVATEILLPVVAHVGIDRQRRTIAITTVVTKNVTRTGENAVAVAIAIKTTIVAETVTMIVVGENDPITGTIVIRNQSASWMSESVHRITTETTTGHKTRPPVILSTISTNISTNAAMSSRTTITSNITSSTISARKMLLTIRAKERNLALDYRDRIIPQVQHHPPYEFSPEIWVRTKTCFEKSERSGMLSAES
jgi:hypothetical protein